MPSAARVHAEEPEVAAVGYDAGRGWGGRPVIIASDLPDRQRFGHEQEVARLRRLRRFGEWLRPGLDIPQPPVERRELFPEVDHAQVRMLCAIPAAILLGRRH